MKSLRIHFITAAIALAVASCGSAPTASSQAPSKIPIPEVAPKPDVTRTEASVRRVEDRVESVEGAVRDVGRSLDDAAITASALERAVENAYINGVESGSSEANLLKTWTFTLQEDLKKTQSAREVATQSLIEARLELKETDLANLEMRSQIEKSEASKNELIAKLKEANDKIEEIIKIAKERDDALRSMATVESERDEALKYKRAVWIGVAIIAIYLIIKLVIFTGKWTPQGRAAKFFL